MAASMRWLPERSTSWPPGSSRPRTRWRTPPYRRSTRLPDNHAILLLTCLVQSYPLIASEIGQQSCGVNLINPVIDFLESKGQHFLAWQWVAASCDGSDGEGNFYGLI